MGQELTVQAQIPKVQGPKLCRRDVMSVDVTSAPQDQVPGLQRAFSSEGAIPA